MERTVSSQVSRPRTRMGRLSEFIGRGYRARERVTPRSSLRAPRGGRPESPTPRSTTIARAGSAARPVRCPLVLGVDLAAVSGIVDDVGAVVPKRSGDDARGPVSGGGS